MIEIILSQSGRKFTYQLYEGLVWTAQVDKQVESYEWALLQGVHQPKNEVKW